MVVTAHYGCAPPAWYISNLRYKLLRMTTHQVYLLLHVLGAILWVGTGVGMAESPSRGV
jgi:hypothetical protein